MVNDINIRELLKPVPMLLNQDLQHGTQEYAYLINFPVIPLNFEDCWCGGKGSPTFFISYRKFHTYSKIEWIKECIFMSLTFKFSNDENRANPVSPMLSSIFPSPLDYFEKISVII